MTKINQAAPNVGQIGQVSSTTSQSGAQGLQQTLGQIKADQSGAQALGQSLQGQVGFNGETISSTFGQQAILDLVETLAQATEGGGATGGAVGGGGDTPVE